MVWYALLLIQVGLQILSGLLTSKGAKPEKNLDLPHVDASTSIPVPFGICLIKDPMLLDYMDFKPEAIKIRNPATFFITTLTTGYNYYLGMVFGICWGVVSHENKCRLLEILIDNRTAWSGANTAPTESGNGILNGADSPIIINRPSFFGSEKQEGGVRVQGYWYCGTDLTSPSTSNQTQNAYWEAQRAVTMPNYKGVAYFVWHGPGFGNLSPTYGGKKSGMIGNAPRLWPLAFKVSRYPRALTEGLLSNEVSDTAYADSPPIDSYKHGNPIEALYECLTSTNFGAGIDPAHIYAGFGGGVPNTFADAAVTCALEGLAFDYLWTSSSPVEDMISEILRYVDGAIWTDPADGLIKIKLARNDYTLATLPILSNSDFLEISSFTRGSWRDTKNEVRISFPDQSKTDFETNTATWRNPANYQVQGANEPVEITFRGCPTLKLASRLAAREGRVLSTPLAKLKGTIDRKSWLFHPCTVFKFNWPEEGISNLVMRVTTMNLGTLLEGTIEIQCVQDVFAAGSATYVPANSTLWSDPLGGNAQDSPNAAAGEIPYWLQRDNTPRVFGVASKPSSAHLSYDGSIDGETDALGVEFTPTGTLKAALDQLAQTDFNAAGFRVENVVDADLIEAGTTTTIAAEGASLAIIGNPSGNHEWIAFEGFTNNNDGTVDLANVWRGLLDTPPRDWPLGTRVYFFSVSSSLFVKAYAEGNAVIFEALTRTMRDQLLAANATDHSYTLQSRALRPLPPFFVQLGGSYTNRFQALGDLVFAWREHSRLTALSISRQSATTETAEAGVTYEVDIYGQDNTTLLRTVTGLTSPAYTYTNANELSDSGSTSLQFRIRAEFFSKRDGKRSLYPWIRYVYRSELETVVGQSSVSASLFVNTGLTASVDSVSTVSAGLTAGLGLSASVDSISIVTADLTNTAGVDPDLVLWLAAWKETGLTNGDRLTTLTDQSNAANDYTAPTSSDRPRWDTGILNGQPGYFFGGDSDHNYVKRASHLSGEIEAFFVIKLPSTQNGNGFCKFGASSQASHCCFGGSSGQLYTDFGANARTFWSPTTGVTTAGFILQIVAKSGTNAWQAFENGNTNKSTQTLTQAWSTTQHQIGASSDATAGNNQTNWFHGWILEARFYQGARTTAQRNAILAELNSLYGITVTNF